MRLVTSPCFCDGLLLASMSFHSRPVLGLVREYFTTIVRTTTSSHHQQQRTSLYAEAPSSSSRFFSGRKRVLRPSNPPTTIPIKPVLEHEETVNNDDSPVDEEDEMSSTVVEAGHVYYVATPLGNMKDITLRAIEVLTKADVICAEDTRHTIKLLRRLNLPHKELLSHHEHNWQEQLPKIVGMIQHGKSVAVVSDAGTPGISDPGAELAAALVSQRIPVHPVPGPSAVIAALSISGFVASEFTFLGFLAVKG